MGGPVSDEELIGNLREIADKAGHSPSIDEAQQYGKYSIQDYQERFGTWQSAVEEAGLSSGSESGEYKITNRELLDELNHLARSLGKTPSVKEMGDKGKYSGTTYRNRFGTWNEAVLAAGLEPNVNRNKLSNDVLIENLKEFALGLGHTPTQKEMREKGPHASSTYVSRFGTWNEAVQEAGLEPNIQGSKPSDQDLIDELERVAAVLGRIPTQEEFEQESELSTSTYYTHFDTWKAAINKGNLEEKYDLLSGFDISSEDLLDEIKRFVSVLGRAPTIAEMNELGAYSERTYRRRFGSWSRSLERAGVEESERERDKTQITEQELIAALQALANELGRSPSFEDMRNSGKYGAATYLYRFGSWNQALRAAGLQPRLDSSDQIPDRNLIIELRRLAGELGHIPQRKEMENAGEYSGMTYYNRFGSWKESLSVAGFSEKSAPEEAYLAAHCFTCAREINRPISDLTGSKSVFCDDRCRYIWEEKERIQFEELDDEFHQDGQTMSDIFTELSSTNTLVPEILACLRLAITILPTTIDSAVSGDYRVEKRKNDIAITRLNTEGNSQILIAHETARRLHETVVEQSNSVANTALSPTTTD